MTGMGFSTRSTVMGKYAFTMETIEEVSTAWRKKMANFG
jgi:hypothetical protein